MGQIITGLAKNQPGVLAEIGNKIRELNVNVSSISAAETDDKHLSNITLVVDGTTAEAEKVREQLGSVLEILKSETLGQGDHYERELVLVRVSLAMSEISHIMQVSEVFHANVAGVGKDTVTLELSGEPEQVKAFLRMLQPFGIREMARTGLTALKKD